MSSITTVLNGAIASTGTDDLYSLREAVETALVEREQGIAEQIVTAVVEQFGVPEGVVRERLGRTGMAVTTYEEDPLSGGYEADIEGDDEEDEADAPFDEDEDKGFSLPKTPPPTTPTIDDDIARAVAGLIRVITARLS